MQKYAIVKNGVVVNIAKATGDFAAIRPDWIACDDTVKPGFLYSGNAFSAPPRNLDAERVPFYAEIRKLLRATDWTQMPDGPVGQERADWLQYRAALRVALRNPTVDPQTFEWPEAPGSLDES